MKNNLKYTEKQGFAPIILLIIGAIIALVITKHLQKTVTPKTNAPLQINQTKNVPINTISNVEQQKKLEKYITVEAALLGVADNISLFYKDLSHQEEFSMEPTKPWIPASTIKAYVVLEAFRQRDLGLINFNQQVTISPDNVVPTELETDEFPRLREGTKVTIKQLVEAMIIQSDNTAYNTLLDILDRRNINLALKNIALTETVVGEKLNLDDNQFQADLKVPGRQPNTTTVQDLATFFDLLYNHKIADSDEILSIFKRQKINNMIPALLPSSTEIAHKTGDWAPIYHDGGVIFKPNDPFVLTIFTNTGDPGIVAKLAKVAYYQTADSVGQQVSQNTGQPPTQASSGEEIALNESDSNVLAASTNTQKFPAITAADLGIKQEDLSVSPKDAQNVWSALITPGSFLYNLKDFIRNRQLQFTIGDTNRAQVYLDIAKDKLSEVKTLLEKGDVTETQQLLDESEQNLKEATALSQNNPDQDLLLVQIKQVNDLHFAVLNQSSNNLPNQKKEQFIDAVYNFYQKNKQEVTPVVNTSVIANATQQKPAIGTVTQIQNNTATIQFDDGTKKDVILNDGTKVRSFQQTTYQSPSSISVGNKIAVVGITNTDSKIIPEFILKDVPKELPNEHKGTVIEINPDQNTLRILDQKGQQEIINVSNTTLIQSKDTNVSLTGIKAGSEITVFGVTTNNTSQSSSLPKSSSGSSSAQIATNGISQNSGPSKSNPGSPSAQVVSISPNSSATLRSAAPSSSLNPVPGSSPLQGSVIQKTPPSPTNSQTTQKNTSSAVTTKPVIEVKATSVTVTSNSSGKNEVITNKPTPAAPAPAPAQSNNSGSNQKAAPPAKKDNTKPSEDKPKNPPPPSKK